MQEWKQNIGFALLGVLLAGLGCYFMAGEFNAKALGITLLGLFLTLAYTWLSLRDIAELLSARKEKVKLGKPAKVELVLPYHELAARFQALAKVDAQAWVQPGYLAWNSQSFGEIRIRRLNDTEWMAIYWVRSTWHYTDAQMRQVCRTAALDMPEDFRKMKAHGLMVYNKGVLSIYPESHRKMVEEAFVDNILLPNRDAFKAWLADYGEDES